VVRFDMGQPPRVHVCVANKKTKAAAAARIGAELAGRKRDALLERLRPCFKRVEPFVQARKYVRAVMSDLPARNGWSVAEWAGDLLPDRTQRLLSRAAWDAFAAMSEVRKFAVAGLEAAARRGGRRKGQLAVGALDETGQAKKGECTAGVKRQYMGCADGVANGISTVHLSYVREKTGHALTGFRQWIPEEHIASVVTFLKMALPLGLKFLTKGQLAIEILREAFADGVILDFVCGDEVYGNCTKAAGLAGRAGAGVRAAGAEELPHHPRRRHRPDLRRRCRDAAQARPPLGGPLRREGTQGRPLVRLGVDPDRLAAALPAGPPPPEER
jgi:DDE superfamily endonuclease